MLEPLVYDRQLYSGDSEWFAAVSWVPRDAKISDSQGNAIFEAAAIESPSEWSQMAVNVVSSKYFYPGNAVDPAENSIKDLIERVVSTISGWGLADGYFKDKVHADNFKADLGWLIVNQFASFNSPVWFNCGIFEAYPHCSTPCKLGYHYDAATRTIIQSEKNYEYPQLSACFIQSVEDDLDDIMDLAKSEAILFKHGSGTGTDLSTLRSTYEHVAGGGTASGPLSFLKIYDTIASVIRSGGRIRRAAKLNVLSVSHPDIKEWVFAKVKEEAKAKALIEQGYSADFGGEAYKSIWYQNENLSVKASDAFMQAVQQGSKWPTSLVTTKGEGPTYLATELFDWIADSAHKCGDPGLQFSDTINKWNTLANDGTINTSNPCGEFLSLDNSACNLASLNLLKFVKKDMFDYELLEKAVRVLIIAQDILIDRASYPTKQIAENSISYRPLGLGYANLGALLMLYGIPYGSKQGCDFAATITAYMTGFAYKMSAELVKVKGAYNRYPQNQESMSDVLNLHYQAVRKLAKRGLKSLVATWKGLVDNTQGFRNSQVTLLAPVGTIGFMMDCDTTGIEPELALVRYKTMVGGGVTKLVNTIVPETLKGLNYTDADIKVITDYIAKHGTIEGCNTLKAEHLDIFDCALCPEKGKRYLKWADHISMVAAVQPFLSGAVSKTINLPADCTPATIKEAYLYAWQQGLKGVTVYRDGCKGAQPLSTSDKKRKAKEEVKLRRRRLPTTRGAQVHKFTIGGHEGYFTVGLYPNGEPGELFINMSKEGSTIGGLMDAFGTAISMCLQYGVPLKTLINKFMLSKFDPSGFTGNKEIPMATSLIDYIFRWVDLHFCKTQSDTKDEAIETSGDNPLCDNCGSMTVRNGACFKCTNCGSSLGCS